MSDRTVSFSELASEGLIEVGAGRPRSVLDQYPSIPILRVADVLDGRIESPSQDRIPDGYQKVIGSKISKPGDVVLTAKGTVGRVALMPPDGPDLAYSPQLCYFRPAARGPLRSRYLYYWFKSTQFWNQADALKGQTDMADYLSLSDIQALEIRIPSLDRQDGIIEVLGSLDDKITANDRIAETTRALARVHFRAAQQFADPEDVNLASVVEFLNRGIAPRYTEDRSHLCVLNQKCIRDGRVSLAPSRWTLSDKVPSEKMLRVYDVLVNSTGMGTLGRIARWTRHEACTVDSHVTIVRFDPAKIDPVCAGFAMLDAETEIESLGQGSTGQTELGRAQLSGLRITVPSKERVAKLRPMLDALENRGDSALEESLSLAWLRDTLLPRLMSGEIRTRDAEKVVGDVT
jgi:type I restriction enzyme, S subunit